MGLGGFREAFWKLIRHVFASRYYDGGVSSVYFWDLDDGFAGVVLLKKSKAHSFNR